MTFPVCRKYQAATGEMRDTSSSAPNHGTRLLREDGSALSLAQLLSEAEGRRVQVTASLVVQNPGGVPEALAVLREVS